MSLFQFQVAERPRVISAQQAEQVPWVAGWYDPDLQVWVGRKGQKAADDGGGGGPACHSYDYTDTGTGGMHCDAWNGWWSCNYYDYGQDTFCRDA
jgi:hypothetical protein